MAGRCYNLPFNVSIALSKEEDLSLEAFATGA